jgi:hypothetical protein
VWLAWRWPKLSERGLAGAFGGTVEPRAVRRAKEIVHFFAPGRYSLATQDDLLPPAAAAIPH